MCEESRRRSRALLEFSPLTFLFAKPLFLLQPTNIAVRSPLSFQLVLAKRECHYVYDSVEKVDVLFLCQVLALFWKSGYGLSIHSHVYSPFCAVVACAISSACRIEEHVSCDSESFLLFYWDVTLQPFKTLSPSRVQKRKFERNSIFFFFTWITHIFFIRTSNQGKSMTRSLYKVQFLFRYLYLRAWLTVGVLIFISDRHADSTVESYTYFNTFVALRLCS